MPDPLVGIPLAMQSASSKVLASVTGVRRCIRAGPNDRIFQLVPRSVQVVVCPDREGASCQTESVVVDTVKTLRSIDGTHSVGRFVSPVEWDFNHHHERLSHVQVRQHRVHRSSGKLCPESHVWASLSRKGRVRQGSHQRGWTHPRQSGHGHGKGPTVKTLSAVDVKEQLNA